MNTTDLPNEFSEGHVTPIESDHEIRVETSSSQRLDHLLVERLQITRSEAQRLIDSDNVKVNDLTSKPNRKLKPGDIIHVTRPKPVAVSIEPESIPLDIIFEDSHILVVNKARGMVVHPAPGSEKGTLVNAVLGYVGDDLGGIGGELRPGIVHRLDKDTSGLMVVAKTEVALNNLQLQIQTRRAERKYIALIWGTPNFQKATVDAPIGRHPTDRKRMAVITDSRYPRRDAVTEITVTQTFRVFSLIQAKLQTGRTHQIRVHCSYISHPVVGDPVYRGMRKVPAEGIGFKDRLAIEKVISDLGGQALHAYSLSFDHPVTGENLHFETEPPVVMSNLISLVQSVYTGSAITNA